MLFYSSGDRIKITKGTYKHKLGTFIGKSGLSMCYVKIDNDLQQRRIRLSSIAPIGDDNDAGGAKEDTIKQLLKDLAKIWLTADAMEKKIKELKQEQRIHWWREEWQQDEQQQDQARV